ncbi:MAG TPA: hypothetical protein VFT49_02815 [Candidatus Saccharimonadales bacterium]|nr:hypothetical protein [Candidatus Saccharimonadales bacterium]
MSKRQIVGLNRLLLSGLASLLLVATMSFGATASADTVTKSYFKSFGSDVFIGGAFNTSTKGNSCNANYQYATASNPNDGGVFAFAKDNGGKAAGGASSQYGAIALGPVQGNAGSSIGFYSGGAQAGSVSHSYTTFANTASGSSWGGGFEGNVPQSSCIPDYYDLKIPKSPTALGAGGLPGAPTTGSYSATGSPYHLDDGGAVNIAAGVQVTVFVNGPVYITHNITYTLDKVDNVPKFALIAKGSIYIDPSVSELDGVYISQPATSNFASDDGNIWTCHGATSDQVLYSYPAFLTACSNKLTVNGAFIAKQVILTRINGDVTGASTGEDNLGGALGSGNIGEVINYSPAMIMGGPFFNPSTTNTYKVESVTSLPPIF